MMSDNFPAFTKDFGVDFFGKSSYPKVDIIDNNDSIEIHAEIPGLGKEDVEIKVEHGNILSIRGGVKKTQENSSPRSYICKELKRSSFARKFALDETLDAKSIEAKFFNGILEITIPKITKKVENDVIEIKIQ
jgi:HSP20 family protein